MSFCLTVRMPIDLNPSCKFCGKEEFLIFQAKERMLQMPGEFTYHECQSCKSIQLIDIPENLSDYYPVDSYYSQAPLVESSNLKNQLKSLRLKLFLNLPFNFLAPSYGYWLKKINPKRNYRIADLGCGNGQLLYEMYASGYQNLEGFDPFIPKTKKLNSNLTLWKKPFEDSVGFFDLIMMHHAFEHMADPKAILELCFEKLNPGGKILIRTPVTDAEVWKEKREMWVQLDAPRHLVIPSVKGFSLLAEHLGFSLDEVVFDSTEFQFWGTSLYEKGYPLNPDLAKSMFTSKELTEMKKRALRLNQEGKGDQVCFYLTKPIKS